MIDKNVIIYEDYTDEELITWIIENKLKKSDKIILEYYMKCDFRKSVLARRLKSSKYIVDKEINRIYFLINKYFNNIKNN